MKSSTCDFSGSLSLDFSPSPLLVGGRGEAESETLHTLSLVFGLFVNPSQSLLLWLWISSSSSDFFFPSTDCSSLFLMREREVFSSLSSGYFFC